LLHTEVYAQAFGRLQGVSLAVNPFRRGTVTSFPTADPLLSFLSSPRCCPYLQATLRVTYPLMRFCPIHLHILQVSKPTSWIAREQVALQRVHLQTRHSALSTGTSLHEVAWPSFTCFPSQRQQTQCSIGQTERCAPGRTSPHSRGPLKAVIFSGLG
jgi:hypothetical protein